MLAVGLGLIMLFIGFFWLLAYIYKGFFRGQFGVFLISTVLLYLPIAITLSNLKDTWKPLLLMGCGIGLMMFFGK